MSVIQPVQDPGSGLFAALVMAAASAANGPQRPGAGAVAARAPAARRAFYTITAVFVEAAHEWLHGKDTWKSFGGFLQREQSPDLPAKSCPV